MTPEEIEHLRDVVRQVEAMAEVKCRSCGWVCRGCIDRNTLLHALKERLDYVPAAKAWPEYGVLRRMFAE